MIGSQIFPRDSADPDEEAALSPAYPISKNYLAKLLMWIFVWALILIGFIWVMDPYGVSPVKIKITGINEYKPRRLDIDRLIKPLEVWRRQPASIFIGTSRTQQSMDPSFLDGTEYAPAYNASIPSSTIQENTKYIEQFLKLDPKLKHIFVELFIYSFTPHPLPDPAVGTWTQFSKNIASLQISMDALVDSIKTLCINKKIRRDKGPAPAHIADLGYRIPTSNFNPGTVFSDKGYIHSILLGDHQSKMSLANESYQYFEQLLSLAENHGVKVHLIITPSYPWDDYRLITLGYWPLLEQWLRKMATYSNVVSFSQYNPLIAEQATLEPRMKWWNDPLHFSLNMGHKMLKAYIGKPDKDTPKNFMLKLNPQTVEDIIAQRHAGALHWAAKHPEFVKNFEMEKIAIKKELDNQQQA